MTAVYALRARAATAVAVLVLAPAALLAQGPGTAAFRQGADLRKAGNCDGAIVKFNEAINLERTNYRYYAMRGDCELKLRKYNESIQSYRQALQLNRDYTSGHIRIAMAYLRLKNYNSAIQALNSAYDGEKDQNKRLSYKLYAVKLLVRQNRPQEAMAELNKLKATAGEDARVLQQEGDIYAAQNNFPAAIASYQKALDKVKSQPIAQTAKYYYSLGQAYFKSGNTAKAKETWEPIKNTQLYKRAQQLMAVSGANYQIRVAQGYLRANLLDEAIEFSNKAIQAEPANGAGYQMLAMVQMRKSQTSQALANLNKAAELQQDEAKRNKLYSSIVSRQFNSGDYAGALNTANKILAKNPTNAAVLGLKAQAEYQLGQFQNAIATAEKAIAAGKGDQGKVAAYQFTQGLAAKRAGQLDQAKTLFSAVQKAASPFRFAARNESEKLAAR